MLDTLTLHTPPGPLARFGARHDGGYLVETTSLQHTTRLLSAGLGRCAHFELDILRGRPHIHAFAFDGTIKKLPRHLSRRLWIRAQNIGPGKRRHMLHDLIIPGETLLKMDIEGSEFPWLAHTHDYTLAAIRQIILEVHDPFSATRRPLGFEGMQKLARTHFLIHAHANNNGLTRRIRGQQLPRTLELTYLSRRYYQLPKAKTPPIPHPLDRPNNPKGPDACLHLYLALAKTIHPDLPIPPTH